MAWPDIQLPAMLGGGAQLTGNMQRTHVFRQADVPASTSPQTLLDTADDWIQAVLRRPPPRPEDSEAIWRKTVEERDLGLMEGPFDRDHFDRKFQGRWRPIVRFCIYQADGKLRVIDDGRSCGTNQALESDSSFCFVLSRMCIVIRLIASLEMVAT